MSYGWQQFGMHVCVSTTIEMSRKNIAIRHTHTHGGFYLQHIFVHVCLLNAPMRGDDDEPATRHSAPSPVVFSSAKIASNEFKSKPIYFI